MLFFQCENGLVWIFVRSGLSNCNIHSIRWDATNLFFLKIPVQFNIFHTILWWTTNKRVNDRSAWLDSAVSWGIQSVFVLFNSQREIIWDWTCCGKDLCYHNCARSVAFAHTMEPVREGNPLLFQTISEYGLRSFLIVNNIRIIKSDHQANSQHTLPII